MFFTLALGPSFSFVRIGMRELGDGALSRSGRGGPLVWSAVVSDESFRLVPCDDEALRV